MSYEPDSLNLVLERVTEAAKSNGLKIISAHFASESSFPQIVWNLSSIDDVTLFVDYAHKLGSDFLYIEKQEISADEIDEAIENLDDSSFDRKSLLKRAKSTNDQIGLMRVFFVSKNPSIAFFLEVESKIHSLLYGDDEFEHDEDESYAISDEELDSSTKSLAENSKFQLAKNFSQRLLAGKRHFSNEIKNDSDFPIYEIVNRASDLYELDIKPLQEEALAESAQRLLDKGMTKKDIAKKLNISPSRLSKLI